MAQSLFKGVDVPIPIPLHLLMEKLKSQNNTKGVLLDDTQGEELIAVLPPATRWRSK